MAKQTFDVIVIGAGPAGEVAAGRLADAEQLPWLKSRDITLVLGADGWTASGACASATSCSKPALSPRLADPSSTSRPTDSGALRRRECVRSVGEVPANWPVQRQRNEPSGNRCDGRREPW